LTNDFFKYCFVLLPDPVDKNFNSSKLSNWVFKFFWYFFFKLDASDKVVEVLSLAFSNDEPAFFFKLSTSSFIFLYFLFVVTLSEIDLNPSLISGTGILVI
jgi:hypothetical protein